MRIDETPQDHIRSLGGETKALYVLDDNGRYTTARTTGWEVEEIVLDQVIEDFRAKAEEARHRVLAGETSPIEYYMYRNWMDPLTLAQAMGLFRWQVRRHFRPAVFARLSEARLRAYARLFRIDVPTLKSLKEAP